MKNFIDISDLSSKSLRSIIEEAKSRKINRKRDCAHISSNFGQINLFLLPHSMMNKEFIYLLIVNL